MNPELWLISYDIRSDRLRYRIERLLAAHGDRLQKSQFACRITTSGLRALRSSVESMLAGEDGSVRYYPVCAWCESRSAGDGHALGTPVPDWSVV